MPLPLSNYISTKSQLNTTCTQAQKHGLAYTHVHPPLLSDAFAQGCHPSGRRGLVLVELAKNNQCHRADVINRIIEVGQL